MFTGTIVLKNKNEAIPEESLKSFLEKNKSCSGMALVLKDDDGSMHLMAQSDAKATTIENLNSLQETFADDAVILFFGNNTKGEMKDTDTQPYIALGTKEEPELVVFLDGQFEMTNKETDLYSPPFFAFNAYLKSKLEMMYKLSGKDLGKLLKKVQDKAFNEEINELCGDRGQITLLFKSGEIISFSDKNPDLLKADWGWSSHHHGTLAKAEAKPLSKLEKAQAFIAAGATGVKRKLTSDAPKPTETPSAKPPEKPVEAKPPAKEATVIPLADKKGKEEPSNETAIKEPVAQGKLVQCPPEITGHKNIRRYYKKNAGFNPPNYKVRPVVVSKVASALSDIELVGDDHEFHAGVGDVSAATEGTVKRKLANPQDEAYLPEAAVKDTKVSGQFPQVVPPKELEGIKEFLKTPAIVQTLDTSSNEMDDPATLQEREVKWPLLAKQTGQNNIIAVMDRWSFEDKVKFAKDYPVAFVKYASENCVAKFHLVAALKAKSTVSAKAMPQAQPMKQTVETPKPAQQTSGSGVKRKLATG